MPDVVTHNPAEEAASIALEEVFQCLDRHENFRLEAGAGAGKTESLVRALKHLIEKQGTSLLRRHQQIACITFTNVASDEIKSRTNSHKAIWSSTIHTFCWSSIKDFQHNLRESLVQIDKWPKKLEEAGGIGTRKIDYELGYRIVEKNRILVGHDDVLSLTVSLLGQKKFREILTARFPIIFIDEYQDTNEVLVQAIKTYFLDTPGGPLIGFFGDHWQKIYGNGCGKIEHTSLKVISQKSNFRSCKRIVDVLNNIRPELPQDVRDPEKVGEALVFHTNNWTGERRTGSHWNGDLPSSDAHNYLKLLITLLTDTHGWSFEPDKTKILMLTHNVLAEEQGYRNLAGVFPYNDTFMKKEDPYIAFFDEILEPLCAAYERKHFGEMFATIGGKTPSINSSADKVNWVKDIATLLELRRTADIGSVIDYLAHTKRPRLPDEIDHKEQLLNKQNPNEDEKPGIERLRKIRSISYKEVVALTHFIDGHTPFSTKHGVKGAEFENVLVVFGRGWNQYDFNQMLEWAGVRVSADKQAAFERNRNLFYVVCSRPKQRLALLFTQKLSPQALATLSKWFGEENIQSII